MAVTLPITQCECWITGKSVSVCSWICRQDTKVLQTEIQIRKGIPSKLWKKAECEHLRPFNKLLHWRIRYSSYPATVYRTGLPAKLKTQDPIQVTTYLQFSHNQSLNIYQKQAYTLHANLLNSKPESATVMYVICAIRNHSQSFHFLCQNATGVTHWNMFSSRLPMCKCLWSCKDSKLNTPAYM